MCTDGISFFSPLPADPQGIGAVGWGLCGAPSTEQRFAGEHIGAVGLQYGAVVGACPPELRARGCSQASRRCCGRRRARQLGGSCMYRSSRLCQFAHASDLPVWLLIKLMLVALLSSHSARRRARRRRGALRKGRADTCRRKPSGRRRCSRLPSTDGPAPPRQTSPSPFVLLLRVRGLVPRPCRRSRARVRIWCCRRAVPPAVPLPPSPRGLDGSGAPARSAGSICIPLSFGALRCGFSCLCGAVRAHVAAGGTHEASSLCDAVLHLQYVLKTYTKAYL